MNPDQQSINEWFQTLSVSLAKLVNESKELSDPDKALTRDVIGAVLNIGKTVVSDLHRIADAMQKPEITADNHGVQIINLNPGFCAHDIELWKHCPKCLTISATGARMVKTRIKVENDDPTGPDIVTG